MAKRQSAAASVRVQPQTRQMAVDISPSPEASEGLTLRREAMGLIVTDKISHANALEFVRGCKQLQRKITDHWSRITRSVDDLKRNLLTLKREDLAPVEEALALVESRALTYANEQARIEAEANERRRLQAEAEARAKRDRELAQAEADALKFEQESPVLSSREARFVELYMERPIDAVRHASTVGYKDYRAAAERLLASQKIKDAIQAKRTANAIREQAAATRQQPLAVVQPKAEASQVAKASGVRTVTSRSAQVVDLDKLIDGVIANPKLSTLVAEWRGRASDGWLQAADELETALAAGTSRKALRADDVFLNAEARQLADTFEAVYPGCRLIVRQGLAG